MRAFLIFLVFALCMLMAGLNLHYLYSGGSQMPVSALRADNFYLVLSILLLMLAVGYLRQRSILRNAHALNREMQRRSDVDRFSLVRRLMELTAEPI